MCMSECVWRGGDGSWGGGGGADNSNVLFVHSTKNISCSPSS